jgi:hypothetical protein
MTLCKKDDVLSFSVQFYASLKFVKQLPLATNQSKGLQQEVNRTGWLAN